MSSSVHAIIVISIHAAREGGDDGNCVCNIIHRISIHAAREGGDETALKAHTRALIFQSTPPVKAATARSSTP